MLAELLSQLSPYLILAPPEPWEAEFEPEGARLLVHALLGTIEPHEPGQDEPRWTASNVVVRFDATEPFPAWPVPGEFVAITLTAKGVCADDWRWPDPTHTHLVPPSYPALLTRAGAAFAYGRRDGPTASVTVAFRSAYGS